MMQAIYPDHSRARINHLHISLARGIVWGLLSGLVATLVMDLILMGLLMAFGQPVSTCFSVVGDTIMRMFFRSGNLFAGSIPFGVAAHYVIGPIMGGIFGGAAVKGITSTKRDALRVDSLKKSVILAVLYAEIMSQPILALPPILLRMTASDILLWYSGSFGMHFIWGYVLGSIYFRGLWVSGKGIPPG